MFQRLRNPSRRCSQLFLNSKSAPRLWCHPMKECRPRQLHIGLIESMIPASKQQQNPQGCPQHPVSNKMSSTLSYKLNAEGDEEYFVNKYGDQLYLFTLHKDLIFAKRKGQPYYAKRASKNEYYPRMGLIGDYPIPIPEKYYAKKANGDQFYPKDPKENDKVLVHPGRKTAIYARKHDGLQFYPKNKLGDDERHAFDDIIQDDGTVTYPMDRHGMPIFRGNNITGQEYLKNRDGSYRVPTSTNGMPIYAKKTLNGSLIEYYPPDGTIGQASDGSQVYAEDSNGLVIFPIHSTTLDEYYVKNSDRSDRLTKRDNTPIHRYAREHQNSEIYPRVYKSYRYWDVIFDNKYARNRNREIMYPLDEYGNEYTMVGVDWKKVLPLGYPVTHDGYVIVPEFQNNPWIIDALQPAIVQSNIIGLLKRKDSTPDYCTNVSSSRLSRSTKKGKYQVIPLPSQSKAASLPALPVFNQSLFQSKTLSYTMVVLALAFLMTIIMIWV